MLSIFFHLLFLGYATAEFQGDWAFLPLTALYIWVFITFIFIVRTVPKYVEACQRDNIFPSFGKGQMVQQWLVAIWIVLLHVISDPANIFFPGLTHKFPETIPMLISVFLYVVIYWLTSKDIRALYGYFLSYKQTAYEFFRARMTFPILFFPPIILWMMIEDLFQQHPEFAEIQEMETFIIAPLFFVGLYIFSPKLFNWAWHANPSDDEELEEDIIQLSEKAGVRVSGLKVWDTFNESVPNAAVAGLFEKFRYVYITNYLLELFNHEQIKAVLCHELGHLRLGHIWTYMIFSLDLVLLSVGVKMSVYLHYPGLMSSHENISALVEVVLFFGIFILVFTAIARASEYQADAFSASIANKKALTDSLATLETIVSPMSTLIPEWVKTHPEIQNRIESINNSNEKEKAIIKKARQIRYGLVIVGLVIIFFSLPVLKTMLTVVEASYLRQNCMFDRALSVIESLPTSLDTHPLVSREVGRIAFSMGNWPIGVALAANAQWNLGFSAKQFSQILHHSIPPKITFYFKFMKFLL